MRFSYQAGRFPFAGSRPLLHAIRSVDHGGTYHWPNAMSLMIPPGVSPFFEDFPVKRI